MSEYKVIVCGSRGWRDRGSIYAALDELLAEYPHPGSLVIVHGACPRGADRFAEEWCRERRITSSLHPADWDQYGKRAGYLRNVEMARSGAQLCYAFWDGASRGTKHMVDAALREGVRVRVWKTVQNAAPLVFWWNEAPS